MIEVAVALRRCPVAVLLAGKVFSDRLPVVRSAVDR